MRRQIPPEARVEDDRREDDGVGPEERSDVGQGLRGRVGGASQRSDPRRSRGPYEERCGAQRSTGT